MTTQIINPDLIEHWVLISLLRDPTGMVAYLYLDRGELVARVVMNAAMVGEQLEPAERRDVPMILSGAAVTGALRALSGPERLQLDLPEIPDWPRDGKPSDPEEDAVLRQLACWRHATVVGHKVEAVLREIVARFSERPEPCLELAILLATTHRPQEAEGMFREAVRRSRDDPFYVSHLASFLGGERRDGAAPKSGSTSRSDNSLSVLPQDEVQSPSGTRVYDRNVALQAMRDLARSHYGIEIPPEITNTHEMLGIMLRSARLKESQSTR